MADEILNLMNESRKRKKVIQDTYKLLDSEIKRICKAMKEEWLEERCLERETSEKVNSQMMYEKVREVTGKRELHKER